MGKKIFSQEAPNTKRRFGGFTLIELLVVVLIIGILSAIALPQYKKAVLKAKIARDLPLFISVLNAQDRYKLANGVYSLRLDELDISLPCERVINATEGDYCYFTGGHLKIFNRLGAYLQRDGEYFLAWQKNLRDNFVTCAGWKNNTAADKVCASYGGAAYPNTNVSLAENTYALIKR